MQTGDQSAASTEPAAAEPHRVAPVGTASAVLRWSSEGVWRPSHTGDWNKIADGSFVEVADVPYWGLAFQRIEQEPVIWMKTDEGPQELIVAAEGQWLTLEGAGLNDNSQPIVFYQRHEASSPERTRSSLRTYNLETGEVNEIVETGGWEAGTHFDHLSRQAIAVSYWWSEATTGNALIDLTRSDQLIWDLVDEGCADGEPGCVVYEHVTVVDGRSVGVRPIWNEEAGWVDQFGLFEFDLERRSERLIVAFPWDNGLWYVEDMFELAPRSVVVSLSDSPTLGGSPLPPLVVSIDSGEAFTMPDATFVRPAWLS